MQIDQNVSPQCLGTLAGQFPVRPSLQRVGLAQLFSEHLYAILTPRIFLSRNHLEIQQLLVVAIQHISPPFGEFLTNYWSVMARDEDKGRGNESRHRPCATFHTMDYRYGLRPKVPAGFVSNYLDSSTDPCVTQLRAPSLNLEATSFAQNVSKSRKRVRHLVIQWIRDEIVNHIPDTEVHAQALR